MRRIVIHRPGGFEQLYVESAADPVPQPGEILVRSQSMGVNYADSIVRMGLYASAKKYVGYPITPGFELAGIVERVAADVTDVRAGARVVALTRFGGYATAVSVPRRQVFPIPDGFSEEEAGGFPVVFLTAHYALSELAHVREGEWVMVHSAGGGVGMAALQIARLRGARTIAVVGHSDKVAHVERLGADVIVDKSKEDPFKVGRRAAPSGFDIILDANGPATLAASYENLRPTGRLVVYGFHSMLPRGTGRVNFLRLAIDYLKIPRFSPMSLTNDNKSVLAFNLSYLFEETSLLERGMDQLLVWAKEGRIKPLPTRAYRFEHVAQAHRDLESGKTVGKLVLVA